MPTKIREVQRPQGLSRFGFRLPIWLFRLHLGWVLGERFLLLTHKGRKSGILRHTVLEVLQHDKRHGVYYVVSGWGEQADWVRNVEKAPNVMITVGAHSIQADAHRLSPQEAEEVILEYARRNPLAMRVLPRLLGYRVDSTREEDIRGFARLGVVFAFYNRLRSSHSISL